MMVANQGSWRGLLRWQGRKVLTFAACSLLVTAAHEAHRVWEVPHLFQLPHLPVQVLGVAIAFFVSFRSNAGYDRWWEGRKLWGKLVNTSRHWATQTLTWIEDPQVAERLVRRQIAYVHLLRSTLRGEDPTRDADVQAWLSPEERAALPRWTSPTHALLHAQARELAALASQQRLHELRLQRFDATLDDLLDVQGGCERIKKTPIPRGYGYIGEQLILLYAVLLPLAVVNGLGWLTVPICTITCLAFALISEAGRVLEDPFSTFWNGLPLSALCRTIERDLRDRLGESPLPPPLVPDQDGILM